VSKGALTVTDYDRAHRRQDAIAWRALIIAVVVLIAVMSA